MQKISKKTKPTFKCYQDHACFMFYASVDSYQIRARKFYLISMLIVLSVGQKTANQKPINIAVHQ